MVFDLAASHPSLSASSYSESGPSPVQSSPGILDYSSFLKHQQQAQRSSPNVASPPIQTIYPPAYFSSDARHHGSEMDVFQNQPNSYWRESHQQGQRPQCLSVQQHLSECSVCRNYLLWQQWNAISHWVVIGLIIIYFFRTRS